jgi:polyadenylation factor subunit 2
MTFSNECTLSGHGWNVNSVEWHPYMGLIATGSRDAKIKMWDPREGSELTTIHSHKQQVSKVRWSADGQFILSASRDTSIRLHDLRMMKEFQIFKYHEKEVSSIAWHPIHTNVFVSGGQDGTMGYWIIGQESPLDFIRDAHESTIHDMLWHPMGHILTTGSED